MSTFVSLHSCLSFCEWFTFTPSPAHLCHPACLYPFVFTPIHFYLHTVSLLRLYSAHSLLIVSSSPSLISSCTDIAHFPTISASCLVSLSISLLGDPLVTSSLLQLPWFRGKGTVITVWIKQTGLVLLYLSHTHTHTHTPE